MAGSRRQRAQGRVLRLEGLLRQGQADAGPEADGPPPPGPGADLVSVILGRRGRRAHQSMVATVAQSSANAIRTSTCSPASTRGSQYLASSHISDSGSASSANQRGATSSDSVASP